MNLKSNPLCRCQKMKFCTSCNKEKSLRDFSKGYPSKCKECHAVYMKQYYIRKPEKARRNRKAQISRDAHRTNANRHNLTSEQMSEMRLKFGGLCWACNENLATGIDHDHACCPGSYSCGTCVRGLLCHWCNTALGLMKDDTRKLESLIRYLDAFGI